MTPLNKVFNPSTGDAHRSHSEQRFVIRRLRRLIPKRSSELSWSAAERVATAQGALAARLADHSGHDIVEFIRTLPVVRVELDEHLPDSHISYWDERSRQWAIVVRATDSGIDRRSSVLHEFKRILDRGHELALYDPRYPHGHVQAEVAADQFASSAMMPTKKVRSAIAQGADVPALARQFRVTPARVTRRLSDLNLIPITTPHSKGGKHHEHEHAPHERSSP